MAETVKTSPMYQAWLETVEEDLRRAEEGILGRNFTLVGTIAENNCLKMHAAMLTTKPSLIYWMPATLEIIQAVMCWREEGLESYFTIDAGPQVKIICLESQVSEIESKLRTINGVKKVIVCKPGQGPKLIKAHLF